MSRVMVLLAMLAVVYLLPAAASGASPHSVQYSNPMTSASTPPTSNAAIAPTGTRGGGLPFTGLDLASGVFAATGLFGIGVVIRYLGRRRSD